MNRLEGFQTFPDGAQIGAPFYPPSGSIGNSHFSSESTERLSADKAVHEHKFHYAQAPGVNIAAATQLAAILRAAGTIEAIEVAITGAASGDRTATVDLQKSTGGGAFATVLSSVVTINSSTVVRTPAAGVVSSNTLADGDILELIVATGGSSGTQPQGLIVTVTWRENPV